MLRFVMPALLLSLMISQTAFTEEVPEMLEDLPQVFQEDFEEGALRWEMTDAEAWAVVEDDGDHVLALKAASNYEPPVRSPHNMARIKDLTVGDFIADFQAKQTGREYGHRDLCFFFGYQDPSHFYYVHLATTADEHANSIFLVNDAPRVSIAKERTDGTVWGDGYHHIRIKRDTASGRIEVFFDDMTKPIMTTQDRNFLSGKIGIGSFDDTGNFDDIVVWGKEPAAQPGLQDK